MNFDWLSFGSAIIGAIVGGLITGYFALEATKRSYKNQKLQAEEKESNLIKSLLQAIHDEIETVYERYQDTMGATLESIGDDEPLLFYYPLASDYFSVYNGNTFLIGRIQDNDLRKQIIRTYTLSKGMADGFLMNNDLVRKYEYANKIFEETRQEIHNRHAEENYISIVKYTKKLKQDHLVLKEEITNLLRALRKRGVLSEAGN